VDQCRAAHHRSFRDFRYFVISFLFKKDCRVSPCHPQARISTHFALTIISRPGKVAGVARICPGRLPGVTRTCPGSLPGPGRAPCPARGPGRVRAGQGARCPARPGRPGCPGCPPGVLGSRVPGPVPGPARLPGARGKIYPVARGPGNRAIFFGYPGPGTVFRARLLCIILLQNRQEDRFVKHIIYVFVGKSSFCAPPKGVFLCRDEKSETTFKIKVSKLFHKRRALTAIDSLLL
jgi:hypothetical protein